MMVTMVLGAGAGNALAAPGLQQQGAAMARELAAEQEYRWRQQERYRARQLAQARQAEQAAEHRQLQQRWQHPEQARDGVSVFASNVPGRSTLSGKGSR